MPQKSGQRFIRRNRAPRVHIEYELETYGSEKKIQLPFIMGVTADLAGKSNDLLPEIEKREFLDIDVNNFNDRMKALRPRVTFTVPNKLSNEGNLAIDLTFQSMDDLTPDAIAANVKPLRELLEARQRLSSLMILMDGKGSAEKLVDEINSELRSQAKKRTEGVVEPSASSP